LFFEKTIRPVEAISGGNVPIRVPRPTIGGIDFTDNFTFLLLVMVLAGILSVAVILVRRGTTGRFLDALRGSPAAATSIGISPGRSRLVAFVLASFIAGFGGGLLASFNGQANYESSFVFLFGLVWLTMVVTAGSRSVQAALVSGITFFLFPALLKALFTWPGNYLSTNQSTSGLARTLLEIPDPTWAQSVAFILFGIGSFTYAKHPEGIIEFQTTASLNGTLRRIERRKARRTGSDPDIGTDATAIGLDDRSAA